MHLVNSMLAALALSAGAAVAHAAEYQHDDGTSESSSGFNVDGNVAWMNTFQLSGGLDTITSIELAFGSSNRADGGSTPLFGGESFNVYVWSGTPNGAHTLLAQQTAFVDAASVDTDVLQLVSIAPVTIPGGDGANFFIGASMDIVGFGWPASFDRAEIQPGGNTDGAAWLSGSFSFGGFDPHNVGSGIPGFPLQISQLIADGQWLLRANAIPTPGPLAPFAAALVLAGARRRGIPIEA